MTTLVIDNSNSRTKFALAAHGELCSEVRILPTAQLRQNAVSALLQGWRFEKVVLASVVPPAAENLCRYLSPAAPVMQLRASADSLPVDFSAYPGRETLGADRVANAVAAAAAFAGQPVIALDAGTAATLDVVLPSKNGGRPCYIGGSIAPGLGTMSQALHSKTACLPEIPLHIPGQSVGRDTVEAMQSGCVLGYRGMLRELIAEAEKECQCRFKLLATGGDAALIAQLLPEFSCVAPRLTLQGIALCAESLKMR